MTSERAAPQPAQEHAEHVVPYLARILQLHLLADPDTPYWTTEGTALFADVSGFTQLSEQLARKGREGAEQITDTIGGSFASILKVAYENGASLLKFGGDALLLWFQSEGHVARACAAAVRMRSALDVVGRIELPGPQRSPCECRRAYMRDNFISSPSAPRTSRCSPPVPRGAARSTMEHAAEAGEILVSAETPTLSSLAICSAIPRRRASCCSASRPVTTTNLPYIPRPEDVARPLLRCLSPAIRAHVLAGGGIRASPRTIAFLRFEGTDALIDKRGGSGGRALHRVVSIVEAATEEQASHSWAPTSTPTAAS